jgi:aminomethyltransferase
MRLPASLLTGRASAPLTAKTVPGLLGVRALSTTLANRAEYQRTPLYDFHVENKARMVPFAGWSMPLSYGEVGQSEFHIQIRV